MPQGQPYPEPKNTDDTVPLKQIGQKIKDKAHKEGKPGPLSSETPALTKQKL